MTYHTNHSFCLNSNWNGDVFDSEVMVYFGKKITKTDIMDSDNLNNINLLNSIYNPDFKNLTVSKKIFDEREYNKYIEVISEFYPENKEEIIKKIDKDKFSKDVYILKEEVFNWLEKNIKDVETDSTNINEIKGWCIGNEDYLSRDNDRITIFFKRQLDALNFIRAWSIFKEPVFYFDYFGDDRRNMDFNKCFFILNNYFEENNIDKLNYEDFSFIDKFQGNINLNPFSFYLLDWEDTENFYLGDKEKSVFLKKLYQNKDISYENNNIYSYPILFNLENTNNISLNFN